MIGVILISGVIGSTIARSTLSPVNCTGMANGHAFFGCKAGHVCRGTQAEYIECGPGEAFNEQSGSCTSLGSVNNPCNLRDIDQYEETCASMRPGPWDHRYPIDFEENGLPCQYFFVCWRQRFMGVQKCQGGVFDEAEQFCSSPERVPPPCGTLQIPPQ